MTGDNVTPAWQTCPTHGQTPNAWGCPECVREQRIRIHELEAEVKHWKANHANMVEFNRQLRERPDLAERAAAVIELRERAEAAEKKLEEWNLLVAKSDRVGQLEEHVATLQRALNTCLGPDTERIRCMKCGKSVSSPVPKDTVVRAYVECPECLK